MTDQEKREKVIKALELCTSEIETRTQIPCETCPYHNKKYHGVLGDGCCNARSLQRDAIALLKAQEPRVMTYDELATFDGAFLIESSAISQLDWVFFFDTDTKSDAIWVEGFDGERYVVYREDYGTYTRCWTSRPTDEQREATPW